MIRKLLAAASLSLVCATGANAAVIFDSSPQPGGFVAGSWMNIGQGQNFAVKVDFANAVTINGFDIFISYYVPSTLGNPVVLKIFGQDPSLFPATPDKYFSTISDVQPYEFHVSDVAHADFSPIHLDAGEYWIGLASANINDLSWTSYRKPDGVPGRPFLDQVQLAGDAYFTHPGIYDLSFRIDGAISGVPEPETWCLLILGFGCIGAMMRMRSRRAAGVRVA